MAALGGAVIAVLGVLATQWWITRHASRAADFGWIAYSRPRRYVDYLPIPGPSTDWPALLVPAAVVGALLAPLLVGMGRLLYRRAMTSRPAVR